MIKVWLNRTYTHMDTRMINRNMPDKYKTKSPRHIRMTKTRLLDLVQEEFPGYDPVLAMVKIATDNENDIFLRFNAHKEVAKYIRPQLRAVEVKNVDQKPVNVNLDFGKSEKPVDAEIS